MCCGGKPKNVRPLASNYLDAIMLILLCNAVEKLSKLLFCCCVRFLVSFLASRASILLEAAKMVRVLSCGLRFVSPPCAIFRLKLTHTRGSANSESAVGGTLTATSIKTVDEVWKSFPRLLLMWIWIRLPLPLWRCVGSGRGEARRCYKIQKAGYEYDALVRCEHR